MYSTHSILSETSRSLLLLACTLILLSGYEAPTGLSTVHIIGFVRKPDGQYSRFDEHHTEVAYEAERVTTSLESAGLQVEAAYDCFEISAPSARSRRIMWVARKPGANS